MPDKIYLTMCSVLRECYRFMKINARLAIKFELKQHPLN